MIIKIILVHKSPQSTTTDVCSYHVLVHYRCARDVSLLTNVMYWSNTCIALLDKRLHMHDFYNVHCTVS